MFPADLITLEKPVGSQNRTGHADLHVLTAELVEALMAKVGINNSNDASSIDYILRQDVVHRTGDEPIGGVKTFSSSPIVPTPVSGTQASNKDYSDTLNPDFYQYSIVRTVASGNLTVSLKNYEGNDPTPTKPVKYKTPTGAIKTITSACQATFLLAGTNWGNTGSIELANKEVDWFVYILDYNNAGTSFNLGISRYPLYQNLSEALGGYTSEKYLIQTGNIGNETTSLIGRFNATLSAGPGYTWSIPATSVIINRPIYETRWLDCNSIISASGSMTISSSVASINKYRIRGNTLEFFISNTFTTGGTASNDVIASLPFNSGLDTLFSGIPCYDTADFISSGIISGSSIKVRKHNTNWTLGTGRVFGAQGFYDI